MPEKFYIIGKFEDKERVRKLRAKLEELGYENSYDWTTHQPIKPYSKNLDLATEYSDREIDAIARSSIVIYLSSREGTTTKMEIGSAISLKKILGKPHEIYAVGDFNTASPWLVNPLVKRVSSEEELLSEIKNQRSLPHKI